MSAAVELVLFLCFFATAPGQPMPSVSITSTTATSISLSWNDPSGSVVDSYEVMWQKDTTAECPDEDEGSTIITDGSTSYTITGLEEGSTYIITVTARNSTRSATSNVNEATTLQIAPSAAPTNVRITAVTSSSISMELEPPNCIDRNGIITGYSVQYRVEKGGNTDTRLSPGASATLSDLVSSTNYSIQVAAVNTVGIGPYRSPIFQITEVEAPVLAVDFTTATSIALSWTSAGSVVNSYKVMWQRTYTSAACLDEDEGSTTITDSSTSYTITGVEEYSSYIVTVTAGNFIGSATSSAILALTLEAAPSAAPTSVRITAVTNSSISMEWDTPNCIDQNGIITGYTVQYRVEKGGNTDTMNVLGGSVTSATLSNLASSTNYFIQVAAVNTEGIGPYGSPIFQITEDIFFQLLLTGLISCPEWASENAETKILDIVFELNKTCQCGSVDEGGFVGCIALETVTYVTFRARIIGISDNLFSLRKWVSIKPVINVEGLLMTVENDNLNCSVALSSFQDPICYESHETSGAADAIDIGKVIGIVAGVIGIIASTLVIIGACCCCSKN